jgi:hypothetical protein
MNSRRFRKSGSGVGMFVFAVGALCARDAFLPAAKPAQLNDKAFYGAIVASDESRKRLLAPLPQLRAERPALIIDAGKDAKLSPTLDTELFAPAVTEGRKTSSEPTDARQPQEPEPAKSAPRDS